MLYSCTHMYPSFVIFDIWALGRSGCQWHKQIKLTHTQRNLRTGFWDDVKKDWLKTKIQNVDAGAGPNTIHINNPAVEYITMFTFLVSDVDSDGYCDSEVHRRLGIASSIMGQLDNVWHQKRLSLSTKLRIYVSLVLSLVVLYGSETWSMSKNWQWQGPVISHAISTPYPGSEMERQDNQYRNKGDNRANRSTFSHHRSTPLTFWSHLPIIQGYTCFTSTTSIHWCLHRHTCRWLEASAGPSTENLASTGERRYGSTHQCLSIHNPGPLIVVIATTLSLSSAAVVGWVVFYIPTNTV